jgi:hypothetical protein
MIRYALSCEACEHDFEAWFASSDAYDKQVKRKLVACPACESAAVKKQIMAPSVRTSEKAKAIEAMQSAAQDHISENFDYVGEDFADEARAMYYGEQSHRPIWGETTSEERAALEEEGVPALPLPPGLAPKKPKRKPKAPEN